MRACIHGRMDCDRCEWVAGLPGEVLEDAAGPAGRRRSAPPVSDQLDVALVDKHSPGPWRWSANRPMVHGYEGVLCDSAGGRVLSPRGEPSVRVTDADARLIAAAPLLLEALKLSTACLRSLAAYVTPNETEAKAVADAMALIRRIEEKQ